MTGQVQVLSVACPRLNQRWISVRGLQFDPSGRELTRSIAVSVGIAVVIAVGKRAWGLVWRKQQSSGRGFAILVLVLVMVSVKVFKFCGNPLLVVVRRSSIGSCD